MLLYRYFLISGSKKRAVKYREFLRQDWTSYLKRRWLGNRKVYLVILEQRDLSRCFPRSNCVNTPWVISTQNESQIQQVRFQNLTLTLSARAPSKVQILKFPTPFRASRYLIFSSSESAIKAHRKILNVHFRHMKFLDELKFAKLQRISSKLKMTQINTFHQRFQGLCP